MSDINVLAELERIGWLFDWASDDEIKCRCPHHDDNSPSCHINIQKRLYKCQTAGCGASGDFIGFLSRALKTSRKVVSLDLSKRYTLDTSKIINPEVIERYHGRIKKAGPLLRELAERGVDDSLIRKYRLGEFEGRITIPIANASGDFVNVRKYLPGAPGKDKMRNVRGHGKIRLYPVEQLSFDEIVVCGGEVKAIVAAAKLNKHGIGAITATAGEGNWDVSLSQAFIGKKVYVCLDIDEAGQRSAQALCANLSHSSQWVGNVLLPLSIDKHPHGDINDFVMEGGSLKRELSKCELWEPKVTIALDENDPVPMNLIEATHAKNATTRFEIKTTCSAVDVAPYAIPKVVQPVCEKDQKECALCPIAVQNQARTIHPECSSLLEMVSRTKSAQREALMAGIGIPRTCPTVQFEIDEFYNVEDIRLSPQLEITNRASDRVMQPAIAISENGLELNETYKMVGRMYPHPVTQQATLVISKYETSEDALSSYKPVDLEDLDIFKPDEWTVESLSAKLDCIYNDLSANVTRIFKRQNLHLMIDLSYHSPLFVRFDGKDVKGWVEVLIVGDSANGKSETFLNLKEHYGLGEKVECKNASAAGLLGGLSQMGTRWFVSWGVIPTHDKRLVCLEEIKGTNTEVLARLTDMRSSGIAEIDKIEKRRTHARTRLIGLSNPRSDLPISAYNFGVDAIKELIGGLEDIRRFDAHLIVSNADIAAGDLNALQQQRPQVDHKYESGLCRRLILWAWTREAEQVDLSDCEALILEKATELSNMYTDQIPILDRGSTRHKIARLSASLAARTFSCSEDRLKIIVRKCHVEYICAFLIKTYNDPNFGLDDYTETVNLTSKLVDEAEVKRRMGDTPWPEDFIKKTLHNIQLDTQDIQDWCAWDRGQAQDMLSFLVRKHALIRAGRSSYRKTPPFIKMLKLMLSTNDYPKRPDFIPEEF